MHHKGRNRHHYEYWTDINLKTRRYDSVAMPRRFLAEMVMDRVAACKVYRGSKYDDGAALDYLEKSVERELLHEKTYKELSFLLTMLKDQGETETFGYIKNHVLKGKPFPWEEMEE